MTTTNDLQDKRDTILESALPEAETQGWSWHIIRNAAAQAGYAPDMADAVFPGGLPDVLIHFSGWADRKMLKKLEGLDPESMRVRDRIRLAVQTRLAILKPYRGAVRHALGYWLRPFRKWTAGKNIWNTADCIWNWAGDIATDYNRYTKRTLLSGVIVSTTLVWLNDDTEDSSVTQAFLDRRIENVMQLGKVIGRLKRA